jgi:hypothetical protein
LIDCWDLVCTTPRFARPLLFGGHVVLESAPGRAASKGFNGQVKL